MSCSRHQDGAGNQAFGADRNQNGASHPPDKAPGLTTRQPESVAIKQKLLYARGYISSLPEEFGSRRERFQELEDLQSGWTVELSQKIGSSAVDATFFSPKGKTPYVHTLPMIQ